MRQNGFWMAVAVVGWMAMADTSWAAGVSLAFGDKVTAKGCTTTAILTMSGGDGSVGGVQTDLLFDSSVFSLVNTTTPCTLASGLPGKVDANVITDESTPAGKTRLRIMIVSSDMRIYPEGTLATCALQVASGAATGTYSFQIDTSGTPPDATDPAGSELPDGVYRNGSVSVGAPTGCCPQ